MTVPCDVCLADKGIERAATHDAPVAGGQWANVCRYCYIRLPRANQEQAVPLVEAA